MPYSISFPVQSTWYIIDEQIYGIVKTSEQMNSGRSGTFEIFTVLEDFLNRMIDLGFTLSNNEFDYLCDNQEVNENIKIHILDEQ